jgi:hypothetical protein
VGAEAYRAKVSEKAAAKWSKTHFEDVNDGLNDVPACINAFLKKIPLQKNYHS